LDRFKLHTAKKHFGKKQVIQHISFECNTGDILGIFGRNGSGKSTLLKMLFGTLKADALNYSINEKNIDPTKNIKKQHITYLPQDSFLPKSAKVRDVIPLMFPSEKKQDTVFYNPLVAKIDSRIIGTLSMGELRLLEVLLIGNIDSKLIMLDEPFSMIEPLYKDAIKEYLLNLTSEKAIILTDHYYDDVLQITNKNIVLVDGKSIDIESKSDLIEAGYLSR